VSGLIVVVYPELFLAETATAATFGALLILFFALIAVDFVTLAAFPILSFGFNLIL
jgi:hypothetical protein